jgi:hypothetical protein
MIQPHFPNTAQPLDRAFIIHCHGLEIDALTKMNHESEIIRAEIPDLKRIVENECWLEGERRGRAVDAHEETIQQRVAQIILGGAGAYLREKHSRSSPST